MKRISALLLACTVLLLIENVSRAITYPDGYDVATHNRFGDGQFPHQTGHGGNPQNFYADNPTFWAKDFDLTGVGWATNRSFRHVAMISPCHYLVATHAPLTGHDISFIDNTGTLRTFQTNHIDNIGGDLSIGTLYDGGNPADVTAYGIAFYPLHVADPDFYDGQMFIEYGAEGRDEWTNNSGESTQGPRVCLRRGAGYTPNFIISTHTAVHELDEPNAGFAVTGDSGGPYFYPTGSQLTIVGGAYTNSICSWVGEDLTTLNAAMGVEGYSLTVSTTAAPNCTATISSPTAGAEVSGQLDISGTASGSDFASYELAYYAGDLEWVVFHTSSTPVTDGLLYRNFDTTLMNEEHGGIRLIVTDTNGFVRQTAMWVGVDNVEITSPLPADVHRHGDTLEIGATLSAIGGVPVISIEIGTGLNPTVFSTTGVTVTGAYNGTVGQWDTSSYAADEFYTLRMIVDYPHSQKEPELFLVEDIYLDSTLAEGWPVYSESFGASVTPVDLDLDGDQELIVFALNPARIWVYHHDGTLARGRWPIEVSDVAQLNYHPAVGDLDQDGYPDILVYHDKQLMAWSHLGVPLTGWPYVFAQDEYATFSIADLDLDGLNEIVLQGNQDKHTVYVFNGDGTVEASWDLFAVTQPSDIRYRTWPAIGNLDADAELEIVICSYYSEKGNTLTDSLLHVFDADGSLKPGWPVNTNTRVFGSPVIGDLENDGDYEILVGTENSYGGPVPLPTTAGGIYVYSASGLPRGGNWPASPTEKIFSLSLMDEDDDGNLEVAALQADGNYRITLYAEDGTVAPGWPVISTGIPHYLTTGDLDADGDPEIVMGTDTGLSPFQFGIAAWALDGSMVSGFPKATEQKQIYAVIADVDDDDEVELVSWSDQDQMPSGSKNRMSSYIWESPTGTGGAVSDLEWPTFQRDAQRTNNFHAADFQLDTDGDFLTDLVETETYGTSPTTADTDGDAWPDGLEVFRGTDPLDPSSKPRRGSSGGGGGGCLVASGSTGGWWLIGLLVGSWWLVVVRERVLAGGRRSSPTLR